MVGLGPAPGAPAAAPTGDGLSWRALLDAVLALAKQYPVHLLLPLVVYGVLTSGDGGGGRGGPGVDFDVTDGRVPWEFLPFFALLGIAAVIVIVLVFLLFALAWLVTTRATLAPLTGEGDPDVKRAFDVVKDVYWSGALTTLLWGVLVLVGFVLLVVPGVIAVVGWTPWAAVVIAEKRSGWDALQRAWELTRGHKLELFWLALIAFGVQVAAAIFFGWLPIVGDVLAGAVSGLVLALAAVLGAVFYVRRTGLAGNVEPARTDTGLAAGGDGAPPG